MRPTLHFIVAAFKNLSLANCDYKTLAEGVPLSFALVKFVSIMMADRRKDIQVETEKTNQLIDSDSNVDELLKIEKNNFIGVSPNAIVILNIKSKTFATVPESSPENFQQFQNFLLLHNQRYPNNQLETIAWKVIHYNREIAPMNEHSTYMVKYVSDLLETNKIGNEFDISSFREHLSRFILIHSKNMLKICLICGGKQDPKKNFSEMTDISENIDLNEDNDIADDIETDETYWKQCVICRRGCHTKCVCFQKYLVCILCQ